MRLLQRLQPYRFTGINKHVPIHNTHVRHFHNRNDDDDDDHLYYNSMIWMLVGTNLLLLSMYSNRKK